MSSNVATGIASVDNKIVDIDVSGFTTFMGQSDTLFGLQLAAEQFGMTFGGTGLGGYSGVGGLLPTTGSITSFADYDLTSGSQLTNTWTGFSFLASDLVSWVGTNNAAAFTNAIWGGADTLNGTSFDDRLWGYGGADLLIGLGGLDELNGGDGIDTASYAASASRVRVNLTTGVGLDGDAQGDTLAAIENLIGSGFNDQLTGNGVVNTLTGGNGNDLLDGKAGADTMIGGDGNDTYVVDNIHDKTTESSATGGTDLVQSSVTFTLGLNVDNLTLTGAAVINGTGNKGANTLIGNTAANVLSGANGADTLNGAKGSDTLNGGAGHDSLTGGIGADNFVFNAAVVGVNSDTITDFAHNSDKIQLENTGVFTALATGVLAASSFVTGATAGAASAHDADDFIIYNSATGQLFYDDDGSNAHAKILIATLTTHPTLSATDFQVI